MRLPVRDIHDRYVLIDGSMWQTGDALVDEALIPEALDLGEQQSNRVPDLSDLACADLGLS